jgi:LuxR family maltose regulon positive regulatory protein
MPQKPTVISDWLLTGEPDSEPAANIPVGSSRWFAWLSAHTAFKFQSDEGRFTAKCEMRAGGHYWYAYRRRNGKLAKAYLGKAEELTLERLLQVSTRLAGSETPTEASSAFEAVDLITALNHLPAASAHPVDEWQNQPFLSLTKIKPPVLPHTLVARPRLTGRMKTAVTLISAPSGSGKSTLLCEWRQTCGFPVAWVALGSDDDTPLRFWSTVLLALQSIQPGLDKGLLARMRVSSPTALGEFVIGLVNNIVRVTDSPDSGPGSFPDRPRRLGLILDDFHYIRNVDTQASVQTFLNHLPDALQVVISGHAKPPLPWGHMRSKGLLTEIDNDELRFTSDEGIDFLRHHTPEHALAHSDMQLLVQRTEGWVAGLKLATLMLTRQGDRHQLIESFTGTHAYLRDYFVESVLQRQAPDVQAFLIKTAILKHLTGPLCDGLMDRTDSADMLMRLWQGNLFLVRSEDNQWYRYHDLFAEALTNLLQTQFPSEVADLHRRAAAWYSANQAPADAVHHLLMIEAWEEAATLIEGMALRELERTGEDTRLIRWLQQLPEAVVQQHKTLLMVYVKLADVALSRSEVARFLSQVEANLTRKSTTNQTEDERDVLAEIQRVRRLWACEECEPEVLPGNEHAYVWQMLNQLGQHHVTLRQGDMDRARAMMQELYAVAQERRHLFILLMAGGNLAAHAFFEGSLNRSEKIGHHVLQQTLALCGRLPEPASIPLSALSRVCYERNELSQAEQLLLRAAEIDPNPASANMPILVALLQAKIQLAQGKGDAALVTLEEVRCRRNTLASGAWLDADLDAYQALFLLRQGHYGAAARLLPDAGDESGDEFTLTLAGSVRAELLLRQDQPAAAEAILNLLIARHPHGLSHEPLLGVRVMIATALFEQHKLKPAQQAMSSAIRLAAPEGFLRPFLNLWPRCAPLLALTQETEGFDFGARAFVQDILNLMTSADGTPPLSRSAAAALVIAASISARERDVMRLLIAGLTNRQIAAQLCVSESTVKAHLDNIYRKLGVNSRTQAIAQAQALKVL